MLVVILSWIYISLITLVLGIVVNRLLCKVIGIDDLYKGNIIAYIMIGFAASTVYAEVFSLFGGVAALCHILLLIIVIVSIAFDTKTRDSLLKCLGMAKKTAISYEGIFYLIFIIFIAFYTSRGNFHTDTGIYHAQAIHYIEEYGVIKGLANIQLHLGYNSSYLPFCALYTFSWIPGIGANAGGSLALHTVTGWIGIVGFIYSGYGLRRWKMHSDHLADFAKIAFLIYIFTNITGFMSPATDYSSLMICHYILCAWLEMREDSELGTYRSGMLSVLALFAASMKLSAAALVLIVIYPLIKLIKGRKWRQLSMFIVTGFIVFLPFLIRNVILTGWLLYPFGAIDLFNVEWKVPLEYLQNDSAQITVWGRCLFDVSKIDMPISQWLPIWWEGQSDYGQMIIYGVILSVVMFTVTFFYALKRRVKINSLFVIYLFSLYTNIAFWFLTAPFIRYGLAFLLTAPLVSIGAFIYVLQYNGEGVRTSSSIWKVFGVILTGCICICYFDFIDNYTQDDLSFVKQHITEPYYITQKQFDYRDEDSEDYNGYTIYIAGSDEVNSYYKFPGVCYGIMLERSEMMGEKFEDGWRAKVLSND